MIDVLAVVTALSILMSLLLPVIQAARRAAQRMKCSNNLRQLGLGCHSYSDTWGRLPWNWDSAFGGHPDLADPEAKGYPDRPFSWIVAVLPFMEEQGIYDKIDFEVTGGNGGDNGLPLLDQPQGHVDNNLFIRTVAIKTLLCPSNPQPSVPPGQSRGYIDGGNSNAPPAARTDYTGNMGHVWGGWRDCATIPDFVVEGVPGVFVRGQGGTPWVDGDSTIDQPRCQGIFWYRGSAKLEDCLDGTANTLMLIEDYHWRGGNDPDVPFDTGNTPDSAWMSPLAAISNLRHPMNTKNKAWLMEAGDPRCHGWSSNHAGGAHGCMADASVQFFSQNMDHYVRYALATRAGGEGISTDDPIGSEK
jgi:hypothetical protein